MGDPSPPRLTRTSPGAGNDEGDELRPVIGGARPTTGGAGSPTSSATSPASPVSCPGTGGTGADGTATWPGSPGETRSSGGSAPACAGGEGTLFGGYPKFTTSPGSPPGGVIARRSDGLGGSSLASGEAAPAMGVTSPGGAGIGWTLGSCGLAATCRGITPSGGAPRGIVPIAGAAGGDITGSWTTGRETGVEARVKGAAEIAAKGSISDTAGARPTVEELSVGAPGGPLADAGVAEKLAAAPGETRATGPAESPVATDGGSQEDTDASGVEVFGKP
jgi:hypothetical protein